MKKYIILSAVVVLYIAFLPNGALAVMRAPFPTAADLQPMIFNARPNVSHNVKSNGVVAMPQASTATNSVSATATVTPVLLSTFSPLHAVGIAVIIVIVLGSGVVVFIRRGLANADA